MNGKKYEIIKVNSSNSNKHTNSNINAISNQNK